MREVAIRTLILISVRMSKQREHNSHPTTTGDKNPALSFVVLNTKNSEA